MVGIELRELAKSYGRLQVLKGIDLEIGSGESFALLGPNGAGKTTLIKIVSTLIKPDGGRVLIDGVDALEEPSRVKLLLGVVSHNSYLYEELTARENLEFYARLYSRGDGFIDHLLKEVGLYPRQDSYVYTFSRGMKQRLSIARALLHQPKVLILDEPTTGLDLSSRRWFYDMVRRKSSEGKTVLLTTHSIEEAEKLCSRAGVILGGSLVMTSTTGRGLEREYLKLTGGEDEN